MKRVLFCLFLLLLISCDKKYVSNIPDSYVYIELDLTFEDRDLVRGQAHKIFTRNDISNYVRGIGYGGVLVYNGFSSDGLSTLFAFDLSCPHEASRDVHLEVDDSEIYAVCPKCNSKYEILSGIGNPVSGPANEEGYYLKSYNVTRSGNKVYIRN